MRLKKKGKTMHREENEAIREANRAIRRNAPKKKRKLRKVALGICVGLVTIIAARAGLAHVNIAELPKPIQTATYYFMQGTDMAKGGFEEFGDFVVSKASSLNGIPAWQAIAMGTGNTADLYKLNTGKIEVGREADICIIDNPPSSVGKDALEAIEGGDPFGASLTIVDGEIAGFRGKDSRPTSRYCLINGKEARLETITEHLFFPPTPAKYKF